MDDIQDWREMWEYNQHRQRVEEHVQLAEKQRPGDPTLELAVIGGILEQPSLMREIAFLAPDHFSDPPLGAAFDCIRAVHARGQDPTRELVAREAAGRGMPEDFQRMILDAYAEPGGVESNAGAVYELAAAREYQDQIYASYAESFDIPAGEFRRWQATTEAKLRSANTSTIDREPGVLPGRYVKHVFAELERREEARQQGKSILKGDPTGFKRLDEATGGYVPGELWLIGGRSGMGKSAMMSSLQINLIRQKIPSITFNVEVSNEAWAWRMVSMMGLIDNDDMKEMTLDNKDWSRIIDVCGELADPNIPVWVEDDCSQLHDIMRMIRLRHKLSGIRVVFVDFLQIVRSPSASGKSTHERLTELAYEFKMLAKELGITIVALSQLNRESTRRQNKRGRAEDLSGSDGLMFASDVIGVVHRPAKYEEDDNGRLLDTPPIEDDAEFIVSKARNGKPCTVTMQFVGRWTRFFEANTCEMHGNSVVKRSKDSNAHVYAIS